MRFYQSKNTFPVIFRIELRRIIMVSHLSRKFNRIWELVLFSFLLVCYTNRKSQRVGRYGRAREMGIEPGRN
jgi:hypothetical protein